VVPGAARAPSAEMNQALYAHMNNKRKMKKKGSWNYSRKPLMLGCPIFPFFIY
jgi:hypothetical protein